jgi:hypothetical protein
MNSVRFGPDLILKSHHRPYVNTEIFLDYIRTVFLPYLVGFGDEAEFAAEDAVLMMDKCSTHVTDDITRLLTEAMVTVIIFAPYTT